MINWTTLINAVDPFVIYHNNGSDKNISTVNRKYAFPTKSVNDGIIFDCQNAILGNVLGRLAWVYVVEANTIGDVNNPSAPSPAPAQTATHVTIDWRDDASGDDKSPSVIVISNLRKWYTRGNLHRKGIHPAVQADYVGAAWYEGEQRRRIGGPHTVGIEGYNEFYKNNVFHGYRAKHIHEVWNTHLEEAEKDIVGSRNPLSTEYCHDIQDRFMLTAMG